ncbi:hypothetical protein SCG7086_AK_00140 [Chlamydiales bacterium SCGC AG-110-P3]|nr:hypothetical protein SCG7086_AK_00140 [Chlamydiales bacterium SCGC AG-110-P3]
MGEIFMSSKKVDRIAIMEEVSEYSNQDFNTPSTLLGALWRFVMFRARCYEYYPEINHATI